MDARRKVVLITGASAGIGADLARVFARHGHDLALVARRGDALETLASEIAAPNRPRPLTLALDVAGPAASGAIETALEAAGVTPSIVVNNAGFGLLGRAADLDRDEQLAMIDLNIRALTDLTLRFLPAVTAARGRFLQVASVAGFLPGPGMAIYYATKAYVVSFSRALARELRPSGVTVTALCPGMTPTGFQARAGIDAAVLARLPSTSSLMVAEAGYAGLMAGRALVVPGLLNKFTVGLAPLMPQTALAAVVDRFQRSRRHD